MASIEDGTAPIEYIVYEDESILPDIQALVSKDLSEPYSVFTYRYFVHNWPHLCICAYAVSGDVRVMIGTIVCKAENIGENFMQGYIAMLTVDKRFRKRGIGSQLIKKGLEKMIQDGCKEIVLETEVYF